MTDTFTWKPSGTPQGAVTLRVRTAQYGDGYSQAVADGVNNKVQAWPLTFDGTWTEMQPLMDFLDAHGGHTSFNWTPPGASTPILVRCPLYNPAPQGGEVVSVSATFQQVFV